MQFIIFGSIKKRFLQNFCLIKKLMMLEIINNNVFEIITLPNNLIRICRLKIVILCSVFSVWFVKYLFSAKMWFLKPQLELWNTNHESLNRTLQPILRRHKILIKTFYHLFFDAPTIFLFPSFLKITVADINNYIFNLNL